MNPYADHVVLRVRIDDAAAAELRRILEAMIASHAAVTSSGGFSNPERHDPPALEFSVRGEPNDFEYRAQARFVDRGAWRVLLDALRGELWLRGFAQRSAVECSLHVSDGDDLATHAVGSLPYPSSPTVRPFELTWIEDAPPWRAAVHLYMHRPPEPETAQAIEEFLAHWQRTIRGYRPPPDEIEPDEVALGDQRELMIFGVARPTAAVWSHPRAIELALDAFLADEAVFHPVVNYACWLHRRTAVQELVID